ncbi:MAG: FkbM family methyltransferase [Actinomycetota bacterium]|nr:FkbM family methyltransferase [Actinomycetota bacterium]
MDQRQVLERLPIFATVERREQAIQAARALRRLRRRSFEAVTSPRYSRPEVDGLMRYLDFDGGYFVEAGANDGFRQSNTYFLERFRGWRGVLIEPIPELFRWCLRQRPRARCFNCALVEPEAAGATTVMRFGDLMSHTVSPDDVPVDLECANWGWSRAYDVTVPTKTLSQVLDEAPAPRWDFLSLDLEGYEGRALRGLDLDRHRPRYILVEAEPAATRLPPLQRLLEGRYELADQLGSRDFLFRRAD